MRRLWLAPLLLSVACASTPIKKADVPALAQADALVLQGCYDCLLEARATYARVGVGKARPLVVARLFETDLLITLREKELALDPSRSFAEAQALGKELPPAFEAARYLTIAEAVPGDNLGWTHRETADFRRAHSLFVSRSTTSCSGSRRVRFRRRSGSTSPWPSTARIRRALVLARRRLVPAALTCRPARRRSLPIAPASAYQSRTRSSRKFERRSRVSSRPDTS